MKIKFTLFILILFFSELLVGASALKIESISIIGNSSQLKSQYIVPWKSSSKRASATKPISRLINEIFAPVEREEFQRRLKYFDSKWK